MQNAFLWFVVGLLLAKSGLLVGFFSFVPFVLLIVAGVFIGYYAGYYIGLLVSHRFSIKIPSDTKG